MKNGLFALAIVLSPFLSFAQNGSVSFGANMGSAPAPSAAPKNDNSANQQSPPCHGPMDGNSFKSAKETVAKAIYEDTKMAAAKAVLASNCVSSEQVIQICKLFGFEQTKLEFAKSAWSKTTDRGNYNKVASVFSFDASKKNLDTFISNGGSR